MIVQDLSSEATVENWLDGIWARVDSGFDKEGESQSTETVYGKETVVFQWQRVVDEDRLERGSVTKKVRFVSDYPLLAGEQTYQFDESGVKTLMSDFSAVKRRGH